MLKDCHRLEKIKETDNQMQYKALYCTMELEMDVKWGKIGAILIKSVVFISIVPRLISFNTFNSI